MNLVSTRIITANLKALVQFYEQITKFKLVQYTEDFAELKTKNATLAIGSTRTLALFGGDHVASAAWNRSLIIEFLVDNVDESFESIKDLIKDTLVQKPTIMPWGNKSLLFRDPDGNLVNFFTPSTSDAQKKFQDS